MTWKAVATSLGLLLLVPSAALGDGGPVSPVQGSTGIAAPGGAVRFVASPAGRNTLIKRVTTRPRRVQATLRLPGSYGIPGADYSGTLTGLSQDGRTLILEQLQTSYPVRATRLLVLDTRRMRIERRVVLPGRSNVDAISPDGRWVYLIHYSATSALRYAVLAYDLVQGRLLSKPIVDPDDREGPMTGLPMTRLMSPGGRWAYTLYYRPSGVPFVHALNTTGRRAVCIDLPSLRGLGFNAAKFVVGPGARTLQVKLHGLVAVTIDARTFAVSTGGPLSAVLPPSAHSDPARASSEGPIDGDGGGGPGLPWELVFLPIAAVAGGAAAVWRRARPRAA
jgi:hypothetical protein